MKNIVIVLALFGLLALLVYVIFISVSRAVFQFGYTITFYQFIALMIILGFIGSYFKNK